MGISESKVELRKAEKNVAVEITEILVSDGDSDGEIVKKEPVRRTEVVKEIRKSIEGSGGSRRRMIMGSRESVRERGCLREVGQGQRERGGLQEPRRTMEELGRAGRMAEYERELGGCIRGSGGKRAADEGLEAVLRRGGATVFSVSSLETLSSLPSTDEAFSVHSNHIKGQSEISKRPLIQNINSKIELLDEGLSDQDITFDEFSSPEESSDGSSSEKSNSEEDSTESSLSSCLDQDVSDKSDTSLSTKSRLFFNKEFIQNFKERYSNIKSQNKSETAMDFSKESAMKYNDYEDSFTEITNMLPIAANKKGMNLKSKIPYSENTLYNKINPMKCSNESLTYNSLKGSEISIIKQARSMPTSKLDISSHSYLNKTSNSLSAEMEKAKPGFKSLCYKFWVDATFDTWKVFHNPRDRRIESIGRMSSCQIRLTKITQRSPKGMLKRQVYVYSSCLSALEKCCKLFDDKFPYFCASAGLNIETSVSDRV